MNGGFSVEILWSVKDEKKPTAEQSTIDNPSGNRPIFIMENIFCRNVL